MAVEDEVEVAVVVAEEAEEVVEASLPVVVVAEEDEAVEEDSRRAGDEAALVAEDGAEVDSRSTPDNDCFVAICKMNSWCYLQLCSGL